MKRMLGKYIDYKSVRSFRTDSSEVPSVLQLLSRSGRYLNVFEVLPSQRVILVVPSHLHDC